MEYRHNDWLNKSPPITVAGALCSQDNQKTKNKDQDYGDDQEAKEVDNNEDNMMKESKG